MDNRRFVTFLVFFFAFTYLYNGIIVPKFFPRPVPVVDGDIAEDEAGAEADGETSVAAEADPNSGDPDVAFDVVEDAEPAVHPHRLLNIGSLDPESGYFLDVVLNSAGAAIESVKLADPKFKELKDATEQVQVVGTNSTEDRTFTTAIDAIDEQLKKHKLTLETIDWEVVSSDAGHATFAFESPNHALKVEKTYFVNKVEFAPGEIKEAFTTESSGFTIELEIKVTNLSDKAVPVVYELQGPVGVVLENEEHTRKYRDIKIEFLGEDDDVTLGAKAVAKLCETMGFGTNEAKIRAALKQKEAWTGAFRYAGVDVQFFAALVAPLDGREEAERISSRWIDRTYPVMIQEDRVDVNMSDISFRMVSNPQELAAKGGDDSVTHKYAFFVGPKRATLLDPEPMRADQVLDYGSYFGFIARGMHYLLDTFYGWGMPYFLAIICLTVLVRGCMFPLSRKQAISAARMKDLQPKLAELKVKYGDDKEKFAKAQMELWRKNNINPLGGCLPLFFQFPVFIALYTCLNTAVDLRLSSFLWIENLAAPDALMRMPKLPFLGSDFNLLPCITVVLFLMQQKMFMPPPADEQAAAQQKMMNFMTVFMGVMFWHVPAGLCIYFIASSVWGIAERKLLGNTKLATDEDGSDGDDGEPSVKVIPPGKGGQAKTASAKPELPAKQGFMAKLMAAAEEAQRQTENKREKEGKGKGKKKGR